MPNYANGKIYKIWSLSTDKIYVGSTVEPLSKRMTKHRHCYKKYKEGKKLLTTSSKIFEHGDAKIELIEKCPCKCKEELVAREGYYIRALDCVNKRIEDRNWKEYGREYRKLNKDKITQYCRANRDKRLQYNKQYRQANKERNKEKVTCECGSIVSRDYLRKHKKTKKHSLLMNTRN